MLSSLVKLTEKHTGIPTEIKNSRHILGRALFLTETNRKSQVLYPLVKMAEKHTGIRIHLNDIQADLSHGFPVAIRDLSL